MIKETRPRISSGNWGTVPLPDRTLMVLAFAKTTHVIIGFIRASAIAFDTGFTDRGHVKVIKVNCALLMPDCIWQGSQKEHHS